MSLSVESAPRVVPAQLSFLTIYCPALGNTDETFRDQVVFYYSKNSKLKRRDPQDAKEEENEKLRQIGLAQGMVDFARGFSNGEAIDNVETEKSRIVLHELERGWWILASIGLTRLPGASSPPLKAGGGGSTPTPSVEYSSREVSPPALLLEQILRAHSIFKLHHGPSLDDLYVRLNRVKFCNILDRYWTRFAGSWDVMLHGSPALDIYDSIKLAAGGELGVGVGEEEWGSGEREVLEHLAGRTEGLVDLVVSRFGEPSPAQQVKPKSEASKKLAKIASEELQPWLGTGQSPGASDGVVFSGIGGISKRSLRNVSGWMRSIYSYGEYAYGVKDSPRSDRRKRRRKRADVAKQVSEAELEVEPPAEPQIEDTSHVTTPKAELSPGIPRPIVTRAQKSLENATAAADAHVSEDVAQASQDTSYLGDPETWMKYLTLGYGTGWTNNRPTTSQHVSQGEDDHDQSQSDLAVLRHFDPEPEGQRLEDNLRAKVQRENSGHFIIGLQGDLDDDIDDSVITPDGIEPEKDDNSWNNRILLRTVHVEVTDPPSPPTAASDTDDSMLRPTKTIQRLRVIVYIQRPFITTLLFYPNTPALSLSSFYKTLYTYLSPLHKPLTQRTSPSRIYERIAAATSPYTTSSSFQTQPIYDLVYDPRTLNLHCGIPNIPEPGTTSAEGITNSSNTNGWTRVEALNVHSQILAVVASTRKRNAASEIERTCLTSRAWWVVWMRLPPSVTSSTTHEGSPHRKNLADANMTASDATLSTVAAAESAPSETNKRDFADESVQRTSLTSDLREALLVRKSKDQGLSARSVGSRSSSGIWSMGLGMGGSAARAEKMRMTKGIGEGIGIDARKYVEGLLSLNR